MPKLEQAPADLPVVPLPKNLGSVHRFIAARLAEDLERGKRAKIAGYPFSSIAATALDQRALRIQSALFTAMEERGHSIGHEKGSLYAWLEIDSERVTFSVYEFARQQRVPLTPAELRHPDNVKSDRKWKQVIQPTGKLAIVANVEGPISTKPRWTDGLRPLEEQLGLVVLGMEKLAHDSRIRRAELDQREAEWRRKWEEERREEQRWLEEEKDWDEVRQLAADWVEAQRLRRFIGEVQSRLAEKPDPHGHAAQWLLWTQDRIERLDPFALDANEMLDAICEGQGLHRLADCDDEEEI